MIAPHQTPHVNSPLFPIFEKKNMFTAAIVSSNSTAVPYHCGAFLTRI